MTKSLKYLLLAITLLFQLSSFGQNRTIDSLKLALKNAKHDTTRCNILNAMIDAEADDNIWPKYNEQLKTLAEKNTAANSEPKNFYLKYLATVMNNIGYLANNQGDIPKALEHWQKGLKISEEIGNKQGTTTPLVGIGLIYEQQGDISKALEYYHKSLKINEEIRDKLGIALSLNNIAGIYNSQGDISKALEDYHKSLKIREEIGDKQGIVMSLSNIGNIYYCQGDIPKALEYNHKSLTIAEEIGDKEGMARSLNNIGGIYLDKGDPTVKSSKEDALGAGISKALEYYHKSLKISEEIKNKRGVAFLLNHIAILTRRKGQTKEALVFATRGMQLAKELGFPANIEHLATTLKIIFQEQNKYKEAFEMYELEIKMRDSINNQETQKAAVKKQMQYDYEKKEAVAQAEHKSELDKQQAVADEKNRKQKIVIGSVIAGLVLVLVFAIFIFRSLNVTRKQKVLIEIKNKETEAQKHEIEEKQKEIIDSITYARRIQRALITPESYIEKSLERLNKS